MGSRGGLYLTRVLFEASMSPEVLVIGPDKPREPKGHPANIG